MDPALEELARSVGHRARWAEAGLWANLVVLFAATVVQTTTILTWASVVEGTGLADPDRIETLSIAFAGVLGVLYLGTGVFWVAWQRQSHRLAARVSGDGAVQVGAGWATAAWILPFVSFVVPYLHIRDLGRQTRGREPDPTPLVLVWWWSFVGLVLSRAFANVAGSRLIDSSEEIIVAQCFILFEIGIGILAAFLGIAVLRRLTLQQRLLVDQDLAPSDAPEVAPEVADEPTHRAEPVGTGIATPSAMSYNSPPGPT